MAQHLADWAYPQVFRKAARFSPAWALPSKLGGQGQGFLSFTEDREILRGTRDMGAGTRHRESELLAAASNAHFFRYGCESQ